MKPLVQSLLALALLVSLGLVVADRLGSDVLHGGSALTELVATAPGATAFTPVANPTQQQRVVADQEQNPQGAIQQVIQRSNEEQIEAIATRDPQRMADTATSDHFQELVQINQDLLDNGVSSIRLVRLEWGNVSVNGTTATATTYETWRTTYSDGRTEQSRDQNEYTLVLDSATWKIQTNDHPQSAPAVGSSPPQQRPAPSVPSLPDDNDTSHNWSGYAATGGNYTAVSGTWTVPEFTPDGIFGVDATWVGIGGVRSRDLIQAGTGQTMSGSGHTQYEAWVEMLPRASRQVALSVHPGDSVTVSITEQSPNNWLIHFTNNTTGQTYEQTQQYTSSHTSAEWVEEAPSAGRAGILPLSNFGAIQFTNATAVKDGRTVSIAEAGGSAITMLGGNNQALAVPSDLGQDGASFTVARTDAPATTRATGRRFGR
jgi:Peptidase A4 family